MTRTITFNKLRSIKVRLPDGTIHRIGLHIEPGPDGGIVMLDDTAILDRALDILGAQRV